jgi:hypothetical protein
MKAFDTMMLMSKVKSNSKVKTFIFIIFALLILILGLRLDSAEKKLEIAKNNGIQINELLYGRNRAAGLSCGVLSQSKADELLGVDLNRSFVQGPDNLISSDSPDNKVFWVDSCRYLDPKNSNSYIELYINSYQTPTDANLAFKDILPSVNDSEVLDSNGLGEKLIYDGGVHYLLFNSRIIQVAANNGSSSELENFSKIVFDNLVSELGL